ncbi:AMP-binding protein, partial [Aciditerrimonas ferrireducens]
MNVCRPVLDHPEDQLALVDRDGSWTWGELRAAAAAWAEVLAAAGVGPGERVALVAPASRQLVARYLAILALGAVAAPLNPTSPATELARELDLLRPALVVADPLTQSEVDQARRLARAAVA